MFAQLSEQTVAVTLYTDAYVVHGTVTSRHRRVTDILNTAVEAFIVLSDVTMDEWGSRASPVKADFAQVNLAAVLFAVADEPVEPTPELRMAKIPEQAFITVPPFRVVGTIHLPPEQNIRLALGELTGRFLPVTDATFWSDTVGEAKQSAVMVAVNHARAQILAPHTDVDPWAGLDRSAGHGHDTRGAHRAPAPVAAAPVAPGSSGTAVGASGGSAVPASPPGEWVDVAPETGVRDPWGMSTPAAADPWSPSTRQDAWAGTPSPVAPATPAAPAAPSVPPSRTGLLGRVHGTSGALDLPRPVGDDPEPWRTDKG